jgi:TPR repeat protein
MPEAVRWFIRAARQGDKTAQHNLGVYYATHEPAEGTVGGGTASALERDPSLVAADAAQGKISAKRASRSERARSRPQSAATPPANALSA